MRRSNVQHGQRRPMPRETAIPLAWLFVLIPILFIAIVVAANLLAA